MSNNYSATQSGKVCLHESGTQVESEFGTGPEFVLSTDRGFICGCEILQVSEQFCCRLNCNFLHTGYCCLMPNTLQSAHSENCRLILL